MYDRLSLLPSRGPPTQLLTSLPWNKRDAIKQTINRRRLSISINRFIKSHPNAIEPSDGPTPAMESSSLSLVVIGPWTSRENCWIFMQFWNIVMVLIVVTTVIKAIIVMILQTVQRIYDGFGKLDLFPHKTSIILWLVIVVMTIMKAINHCNGFASFLRIYDGFVEFDLFLRKVSIILYRPYNDHLFNNYQLFYDGS